MSMMRFIIFISITLVVYCGINYYIFKRSADLFHLTRIPRRLLKIGLITVSSTFFVARFLQSYLPLFIFEQLLKIGSYWLGIMIYLFLAVGSIDILRLIMKTLKLRPSFIYERLEIVRKIVAAGAAFAVLIVIAWGYHNARDVRINTHEIVVPKKGGSLKELNIAVISDLHLGDIIANTDLTAFVKLINSLNPDIILMAGDIIDNRIESLQIRKTGEIFLNLKSRYGVYAVTGNHEYFQDMDRAVKYLEDFGIKFLLDGHIMIAESFYILGRKDRSIERFTGGRRKQLSELTGALKSDLPVILMDHQPYDLHDARENSIDLQISGHTHNGQFFPGNIVVSLMYEKKYGYFRKGNTQYYISSGIGTWGPAIRIGSAPEIVNIKLKAE